jgi:hypothetical protein
MLLVVLWADLLSIGRKPLRIHLGVIDLYWYCSNFYLDMLSRKGNTAIPAALSLSLCYTNRKREV